MLTVHHLRMSQSERIVWLCEELGIRYELRIYDRDERRRAPPEYKALYAFGTAPVITDGDLTLGESGAIVEYICQRHANARLLLTPDQPDYVNYLFWLHFANGSLVPSMMIDHVTAGTPQAQAEPGLSRTDRAFAMIEERLGQAPYFAGDSFTAADIMMDAPRFADRRDLSNSPNTQAYLERVTARPAWQRTSKVR